MKVKRLAGAMRIWLLLISSSLLFGEAVFEGSIAVGTYGRLPSTGLYAASNAFPKNSTVRVTDAASGKSVDVLVVEGLDNPNIFLLLSPEAAERVSLSPNKVMRGRVAQVPVGDPVSEAVVGESSLNPDPDNNPAASLPGGSEQEMINAFIREELAALEAVEARTGEDEYVSPEEDAAPVVDTRPPDTAVVEVDQEEPAEEPEEEPAEEPDIPVSGTIAGPRTPEVRESEPSPNLADAEPPAQEEKQEREPEEEPEEEPEPEPEPEIEQADASVDTPRALAMGRRNPSEQAEWHGADTPLLPELPAKKIEPVKSQPVPPSLASLKAPVSRAAGEIAWTGLDEPDLPVVQELAEADEADAAHGAEAPEAKEMARLLTSPVRKALEQSASGWDRVDLPLLPRAEKDPLLANLVPERASPVFQVADLPMLPQQEQENQEEDQVRLASAPRREAPDIDSSLRGRYPEPDIRDPRDELVDASEIPLLAMGDGPRAPLVEEKQRDLTAPVPPQPVRSVGPIMVDLEESSPPEETVALVDTVPQTVQPEVDTLNDAGDPGMAVPAGEGDLVLESAEPRPPEVVIIPETEIVETGNKDEFEEIAGEVTEEPLLADSTDRTATEDEALDPEGEEPEESEPEEREPEQPELAIDLEVTDSPGPDLKEREAALKPYLVKSLEQSSWYLQLAVFREADAAGALAKTLSATYPVTIHPKEDGSSYRVMVGPLRKDESGALLVSFRAGGYRDAFLRKGN